MSFSLNCLLLGENSFAKIFQVTVPEFITSDNIMVPIDKVQVGQFKSHIFFTKQTKFNKLNLQDPDEIDLWKVDIDDESKVKDVFTVEDIERKRVELKAEFMKPADKLKVDYFSEIPLENKHVHIIIAVPTSTGKCYFSNKKFVVTKYRVWSDLFFFRVKAGPSQQGVPQLYPLQTIEEVLRNAESQWMELKDKLVKKIEL